MKGARAMDGEKAGLQSRLESFVESALFRNGITALILVNAVLLGLETYALPPDVAGAFLIADKVIVYIFAAEILLKLFVYRVSFFRSGWNWFDLIVVTISLIPAAGPFAVLRALRVLRLFRLFSVVPEMRRVVMALAKAIPGMGSIMMVLGLIFYVGAVMSSKLFSGTHPEFFGDLGAAAFTLFQVMTLESWSMGVARPVISEHPLAWAFFVPFIILTSFAVLNMFIAVIVDSLQAKHFDEETDRQNKATDERSLLREEVTALRGEIAELKTLMLSGQAKPARKAPGEDEDRP
ncbi:ion transport protein [Glycocaulis alkaliphilus]|uniref:Ion transport protein n=2 Tax=Glycocaulis alkaliphilus TaxID=1434191 RepID=A0A3T0EB23_9PROT|nr:ion transport protein [Glycocaulis alkaliphilus]